MAKIWQIAWWADIIAKEYVKYIKNPTLPRLPHTSEFHLMAAFFCNEKDLRPTKSQSGLCNLIWVSPPTVFLFLIEISTDPPPCKLCGEPAPITR